MEGAVQGKSQPPLKPKKPERLMSPQHNSTTSSPQERSPTGSPKLNGQEIDRATPFASTSNYRYPIEPSSSQNDTSDSINSPSNASFPSIGKFEAGFNPPSTELNGFSFPAAPERPPENGNASFGAPPRPYPLSSTRSINGNALDLSKNFDMGQPPKAFNLPPSLIAGRQAPPRPPRSPIPHSSLPTTPSPFSSATPLSSDLSADSLYTLLTTPGNEERILLLDLRSPEEFSQGRIKGSVVSLDPIILRDR